MAAILHVRPVSDDHDLVSSSRHAMLVEIPESCREEDAAGCRIVGVNDGASDEEKVHLAVVRELREARGWTQEDLAERAAMNASLARSDHRWIAI